MDMENESSVRELRQYLKYELPPGHFGNSKFSTFCHYFGQQSVKNENF